MRKLRVMAEKSGGVGMEIEDANLLDSIGCHSIEGAHRRWLRYRSSRAESSHSRTLAISEPVDPLTHKPFRI